MSKKKERKQKEEKKVQEEVKEKENNSKEEKEQEEASDELSIEELLSIEKDKNLRLFAEFENFRKRTAKERLELFSTANKDIMTILLPILDNFERSIKWKPPIQNEEPFNNKISETKNLKRKYEQYIVCGMTKNQ